MDLSASPFVDLAADAQLLPFADASFDNIVLFDVFHHISIPRKFLPDAARILRPRGRVVMMEPGVTPGSYLFYKYLHPEPIELSSDPRGEEPQSSDDCYDSNQALPTLLVTRYLEDFRKQFPEFSVKHVEWMSLLAYPLSGGLRPWSLIPQRAVSFVHAVEDALPQLVHRLLGFRILIVLERQTFGNPR